MIKTKGTVPKPGGRVVLYKAADGGPALDVRLDKETVWLSQRRMAELFGKDTDTIGLHIRNIFREGELKEKATTEESSVVRDEGGRTVRRTVGIYNLDVIISVGYRVKSQRGTQFRIWATRVLREHLVRGYTVNARRLKELKQAVRLIANVAERRDLTGDEAKALLRVVETMRGRFGGSALFGREKAQGLEGSLAAVMQTFGGADVYPSLEEKAANLPLVKNHHFVDGNKRIGAALFLWFLENNRALYRNDGTKRIADNALVAMTLLIAESRAGEKDALVRVVVNLINKKNA